jgi:ketosteroid isomerase-like protein
VNSTERPRREATKSGPGAAACSHKTGKYPGTLSNIPTTMLVCRRCVWRKHPSHSASSQGPNTRLWRTSWPPPLLDMRGILSVERPYPGLCPISARPSHCHSATARESGGALAGASNRPTVIPRCRQGGRMSVEEHKALVRRYLEEGWSQGNIGVLDEILAPNYQLRVLQGTSGHEGHVTHGIDRVKQSVAMYHQAFSDLEISPQTIIAEDDRVVVEWTARHAQWRLPWHPTDRQAAVLRGYYHLSRRGRQDRGGGLSGRPFGGCGSNSGWSPRAANSQPPLATSSATERRTRQGQCVKSSPLALSCLLQHGVAIRRTDRRTAGTSSGSPAPSARPRRLHRSSG